MQLPALERLIKEVNDLIATNNDANAKQQKVVELQAALDVTVESTNAAVLEAQRQADALVADAKTLANSQVVAAQEALALATAEAAAATDLRTREITFLQGMVAGAIGEDPTPNPEDPTPSPAV